MNTNDSSNQLVLQDRPILSWVIGGLTLFAAIVIFMASGSVMGAIPFLFFALLMLLVFGSVNTITADRVRRTLTVSSRSVFSNKMTEYPFSEIANFEVEASRTKVSTRHRTINYRVVMIKTNGERVPMQSVFSSGYNDKARKGKALCEYLNLPGWEDKPTNLFQSAMFGQVAMTAQKSMAQQDTTGGVAWNIEVHSVGGKQVTRWISTDYTCPGNFLLVSQKPTDSPVTFGGGGGLLGNLVQMVYKQVLGLYGFLPGDTPGFDNARPVTSSDDRFNQAFSTLASEPNFGHSVLNEWTVIPIQNWADRHPLKSVNTNEEFGQLAVLYSPRGLQAAVLGTIPQEQMDELISLGVELVKAQGGGKA
ncbi:MAG: hypothetical protein WCG34_10020 [Leptolinea sp.]